MKSIYTLVPDVQEQVTKKGGWFDGKLATDFSADIANRLTLHFGKQHGGHLRLSQMGPRCPRALWHSIHHPELAEALPPWAEVKYAFGHIIEGLAIALSKAAGHTVTGEQDEVSVDGVLGHRDCIIDGCIVDVKSTSSYGFNKFKDGSIRNDDSFGYLEQLDGYLVGSLNDPLVTIKDRAYLFAIDKQLGHMCVYEHGIREQRIRDRVRDYSRIALLPAAPGCTCGVVKDGESGNLKLDVKASYNQYKYCCFPHLRTFLYSSGPRYLTRVIRTPDVAEIDKYGKLLL